MAIEVPKVFVLPDIVKTDEDTLRCAVAMQGILHRERDRVVGQGDDTPEKWADWRKRMVQLSPTIVAKRNGRWPNRQPDDDDGWQTLKAESRIDHRWDSELVGHPILTPSTSVIVPQAPRVDPYQNLNAATETDVGADRLTVAADGLSYAVTALDNDELVKLMRSFGSGFFAGDFTHYVEHKLTANSGASATGVFYGTATEDDTMWNNDDFAGMDFFYNRRAFVIHRKAGAFGDFDGTATDAIALGTWHFTDYSRATSTVTANIYTGSHGGTPIDTLVDDDDGTNREFFVPMSCRNDGSYGCVMTYEARNFDLQVGAYPYPMHQMTGGIR